MENWTMTRGDTLSFGVELYADTEATTVFAVGPSAANFSVMKNGVTMVSKSLGDGITKKGTGVYVVRVAPEDTSDVAPGEYDYTFSVTVNSDVFTLLRGALVIR